MLVQLPPATTMAVQNMDENPREQPKRPTKVTLNASSDIFARCSKLQTKGTSSEVFLRLDYLYAWDVDDQAGRYKCAVFFPLHSPTTGPFPQGHRDTAFFPLTCQNARNNFILETIILYLRSLQTNLSVSGIRWSN
jgi:hypothetical protein